MHPISIEASTFIPTKGRDTNTLKMHEYVMKYWEYVYNNVLRENNHTLRGNTDELICDFT